MNSALLKRGLVLASSLANVAASSFTTHRFMGDVLLALSTSAISWKSLRVIRFYSFFYLLCVYYLVLCCTCQEVFYLFLFYSSDLLSTLGGS